ncbi:hypothetical protein Hypma_010598 [Hypsizygus marmoreus]|uniref:Uncharacterized protein n=1 Tax=Hypsizygus marmoreus TaxID=39966 RepID=A0A369JU39_HYPMA|nr:hypothetical protein Hypma_010598 [Hypsizygus marmoreus]
MGSGSPTAYLLWAILACIFLVFLIMHLWSYDRFNCLRWDAGRQPGAFKRVMTYASPYNAEAPLCTPLILFPMRISRYSYLATVPLLVIFSVAITVIKFKEGMYDLLNGCARLPFDTRLEGFVLSQEGQKLTFWVFLLNQGPGKREWFASWEFRVWTMGSMASITGMPITVLAARHDIDTCLSYIFLVGSSAGTTTTVFFLYVLGRFPWFIRHVKSEGAEPDVVIRLATFYQLNRIRVIFRFLFTLPLLIIALDGLRGPYPVVDFLLMMGGIGCFISSAITLLIFFPRSITRESGYKAKATSPHSSKMRPPPSPLPHYYDGRHAPSPKSTPVRYPVPEIRMNSFRFPDASPTHSSDLRHTQSLPPHRRNSFESELSPGYESDAESIGMPSPPLAPVPPPPLLAQPTMSVAPSSDDTVWEREHETAPPPRRRYSDGPFFFDQRGQIAWSPSVQEEGRGAISPSQLHPYVINFTSPIDLLDGGRSEPGRPRRHPQI